MASLVQSASNTSVLTSVAASFGVAPTQGNLLIAVVTANVGTGSISLANSGWTTGKTIAVGIAGGMIAFYKVAVAGQDSTVTANGTLAAFMDLQIFEYDGINNAVPLDKTASTADDTTSVTSRASGTSATLTQSIELAFVAVATAGDNGGGASWSNSYNAELTTAHLMTADLTTAATTATSSTASWTNSQRAAGVILTFFGEAGDTYGVRNQIKPPIMAIDWNNPLAKGLVFDMPLFDRGSTNATELASKTPGTLNSGVSWDKNLYGVEGSFDGSTAQILVSTIPAQNSCQQISIHARILIVGAGGGSAGRYLHKSAQAAGWFSVYVATSYNFSASWTGANAVWTGPNYVLNTWHDVIWTYDGSASGNTPKMYLDGVLQSVSTNTAASGSRNADDSTLAVGNRQADTLRAFNGKILFARYWNRILNAQEAKQLAENPWRIYRKSSPK